MFNSKKILVMDNQKINNFFRDLQRIRQNNELQWSEYEWAILLEAEQILDSLYNNTESYSSEEALTDLLRKGIGSCRKIILEAEE